MLRALFLMIVATFAAAQPLPTDPRIVEGSLENGLTYKVLRHANPPGRAVVWMHVYSGSLNETDGQRGVAHYLEHMAFNGSENFPPGTAVKTFEAMGLTFGRHQNAFTGFDQTTYQIALPDNSPEKLATAMRFLADVDGRLLLSADEIDNERQIILEEKGTRLSPQQRVMEQVYARLAPGSVYGERIPIGTVESIKGLTKRDFEDYYSTWYGAGNSTVIAVADLDPAVVVEEIRRAFGSLPVKPRPAPRDPGVKPYAMAAAAVITDPDLTRATVTMNRVDKARARAATEADFRARLVRDLATGAFNRRARDLVTEGRASFLGSNCYASNLSGAIWHVQAQAGGEPAKWRDMLRDLGTQVQRARLHGFTTEEIDRVRRDSLAFREQRAATEDTSPARAIIQRLNTELASGEATMSAAQNLELAARLFPTVTAQECSDWFREEFDPSNAMFIAQLPSGEDVPTDQGLLELAAAAFAVAPEREDRTKRAGPLMERVPAPATLIDRVRHEATGVTNAWLSNGVRFHHRRMDYRRNNATVTITLYGGQLLETAENRGVTLAGSQAWSQAATTRLSSSDIRSLSSGKKVSVGGRADLDSVQLVISGAPADLEFGMQLAHLLLTEPLLEQTAFDRWKTAQLQNLEAVEKNPSQMFGTLIADVVYPDHEVRGKLLTREAVDRLTRERAQAWLIRLIAESPIEVAVVGDIGEDEAESLAARYVGSVAARKRISPTAYEDLRVLERPKGPRSLDRTIRTSTPQGQVMVGFYGPDRKNLADVRAMSLAAQVLTSRMIERVREDKQLAYSISARLTPGGTFPGFGIFRAASPTNPEKIDALSALVSELFDAFAKEGVSEDELATAKRQQANTLDESMKEPSFWLGVLELMTLQGTNLDDVLAMPVAYQAVTAEAVVTAFRRYHTPENTLGVVLRPVEP